MKELDINLQVWVDILYLAYEPAVDLILLRSSDKNTYLKSAFLLAILFASNNYYKTIIRLQSITRNV